MPQLRADTEHSNHNDENDNKQHNEVSKKHQHHLWKVIQQPLYQQMSPCVQ